MHSITAELAGKKMLRVRATNMTPKIKPEAVNAKMRVVHIEF